MHAARLEEAKDLRAASASLRLARHHLADDGDEAARTWGARHLLEAFDHAEPIGLPRALAAHRDRLAHGVADAPTLQRAAFALDAWLARRAPTWRWAVGSRLAHDAGVALVVLIALGALYRHYRGQSLNLWSDKLQLAGFTVEASQQDWGKLTLSATVTGEPISVRGQSFPRGLGMHANGWAALVRDDGARTFAGSCAYPDSARGGSIVCAIEAGGKEVFRSPTLDTANPKADFRVPIGEGGRVTLRVTAPNGNIAAAHAVWINLTAE